MHNHNHSNYIITLGNLRHWLVEQAEGLDEVRHHWRYGRGLCQLRESRYTSGVELRAKHTLVLIAFTKGYSGQLSKRLMNEFRHDEA